MPSKKKVSNTKKEIKKVDSIKKEPVVEKKQSKKNSFIKSVQKRDGKVVSFDLDKIVDAINKAMLASGEGSSKEAEIIANSVLMELAKIAKKHKNFIPTVEGIQDTVEQELMLSDFVKTSKNYRMAPKRPKQECRPF